MYFKYEAIPTFCFICGLIGHSDKFYAKLFDVQSNDIEKPYGAWMRADPKRRSYTMGNKWLRAGSATPVNTATEEDGQNPVAMTSATVNKNPGKVGVSMETISINSGVIVGVNLGITGGAQDKNKKLATISQDKEYIEDEILEENNEIICSVPKRRRVAHVSISPDANKNQSPHEEDLEDNMLEQDQNKKNGNMAGTVMQSRLSL